MNFVQIAGHLGANAETRFTSSGKKLVIFRVGTKGRKAGKEVTIWWRVTLWDDQFEKMVPYLLKGSPIIVYGTMEKPEIFNDREGKPQVSLGINAVYLQFSPFGKPEKASSTTEQQASSTSFSEKEETDSPSFASMDEEEVPF